MAHRSARAALAAISLFGLAGCSPAAETAAPTREPAAAAVGGGVSGLVRPTPANLKPRALSVVVGAHAGAPAPALSNAFSGPLVVSAIEAGAPITMVVNDGTPSVSSLTAAPLDTSSDISHLVSVKNAAETVKAEVAKARPDSDHANALEAILVAASTLTNAGSSRGTVLVLDNLLSDRPLLDTSQKGVLEADPAVLAKRIAAKVGGKPLTRVQVVLSGGIGAAVPPQAPLAQSQSTELARVYAATLEELGATVFIDPTPRMTPFTSIDTPYVVKPTPVPVIVNPPPPCASTVIRIGENQMSFQSNSNDYVDRSAAEEVLRPIADWAKADRAHRSVMLRGTTSSAGDEQGRITRSTGRVETVRRTLLGLGVSPSQVTDVRGVGTHFHGFVKDRDSSGRLVEELAAGNRLVIATLHQDDSSSCSAGR